jgi:AcrR family transcriptional regulator
VAQATKRAVATRDSWALAALRALTEKGVEAVAVEPLAKRLGVTKGSFYWHFGSRAELLEAALELWEQRSTTDIIRELEGIADPVERLRQLFRKVSLASKGAPSHAALAAAGDASVKRSLNRVALARLEFLRRCYTELGMPPALVGQRSLLAYAAYLGMLQLRRDAPAVLASEELEAYTEHVIDTLVPEKAR